MTAPREPFFPADKSIRRSSEPMEIRKLGVVDYSEGLALQEDLARKRMADEIGDVLLLLEHPSVYTAGKRTQPGDLPTNGLPVVNVNRGGRITWHGEGQLVAYPIIKLAEPVDVVDYVRRIEEAVIATVREMGVAKAGRIDGRSGVWVPQATTPETTPADPSAPTRDRKIAALGIHISRGVTTHGLSLNCNNTLDYYEHIVACGIDDADVTTLSLELGRNITPDDVVDRLVDCLDAALAGRLAVADHSFGSAPDPTKGLPRRTTT